MYLWILDCENGSAKQLSDSIDPNNPPESLGRPLRICLEPTIENRQSIRIDIPRGAAPVYHKLNDRDPASMELNNLWYRIGWNLRGVRCMISVNSETGVVSLAMDEDG